MAAFPQSPDGIWSLRGKNIAGFSSSLAKKLSSIPPGGVGGIISHNATGAAIRPNPDACFPLREKHRTMSVVLMQSAFRSTWADEVADALTEGGFALPGTYLNLSPDEDVDTLATYGAETLARLKRIKARYDPEDFFNRGYPQLA
jgi:hypothetical protein